MSGHRYALCLFSGAGGDTVGAIRAGYRIAACIERDRHACASLRRNGHYVLQADVGAIDWSMFEDVDLVLGGPPCQPFSVSGTRLGEHDERDGLPLFIRGVQAVRPRVFVIENVPGLGFTKHKPYLDRLLAELGDYTMNSRILNAADFGIPQARRRLFIVGRRDGPVRWPVPTHDRHGDYGRRRWVSMAAAMRWRRPPHGPGAWAWHRPATTLVASFRPDIVAAPGGGAGTPPRQRRAGGHHVSVRQAARLQAFPTRWHFCGPKTSVRKQIGNACPPPLMAAVVRAQLPEGDAALARREQLTNTKGASHGGR